MGQDHPQCSKTGSSHPADVPHCSALTCPQPCAREGDTQSVSPSPVPWDAGGAKEGSVGFICAKQQWMCSGQSRAGVKSSLCNNGESNWVKKSITEPQIHFSASSALANTPDSCFKLTRLCCLCCLFSQLLVTPHLHPIP